MVTTESSQTDIFAIIVLIVAIFVIVFLVACAFAFYNIMRLKPISSGYGTFLFWTAIIMIVVFAAVGIYALIRIFTHKAPTEIVTASTVTPITAVTPISTVTPITAVQSAPATAIPVQITNVPKAPVTISMSDLSTTLSSTPITQSQMQNLVPELISISSSMKG